MRATLLATAAFAACCLAPIAAGPALAKEGEHPAYLDPRLFDPALIVAAPPPRGSVEEQREIAALHTVIQGVSTERLAQAKADGQNENPSIFNEAVGVDLRTLPATWALLTLVQHEAGIIGDEGKTAFHRMRPYSIDPSVSRCGKEGDPAKPAYRSYPSGHSMLGYSVGGMLARLVPAKAGAVLERAHQYALSRQYCGNHFASDTEASHAIGTMAAAALWNDPRLADRIAAAQAELIRLQAPHQDNISGKHAS